MNVICSTLNAKFIHTNLAIRYLKAYAAPEFNISLKEYTIKDPVLSIVSDLYQQQPDVIGFSCYIWNIEETLKVVNMLKKIDPSIQIVLGGPEVTYDTLDWMEKYPEVDFIAIGEGEQTFKQLLTELTGSRNFENVHGIAYRHQGKIAITPQRNKLDLKELPSPFRFEEDIKQLDKRITYIETSRGCPFNCQFCLSSIEVGVRYFDRERIKEDIRYLMANGAKTIKFVDRTFNISRSYAMEMFRFLIDEHLPGVVFQFEITADIMRPEVIDFLNQEAPKGIFRFEIGVQSTNEYTNELVRRKQNFTKLERTVTMIKDGGKIDQHLDLIAGLPEEDYSSFRKTFNDVYAMRPEELQLGFLKMLRGTGVRLRASEHEYIFMDNAPYEILGNNVLPFEDIVRIKQVEDVLEKYWNDHRMDLTIEYLVTAVFPTPFDFFQEFGAYWDQQGWSRIGHQLEDLFRRLYSFLEDKHVIQLDVITGFMKYDYLKNHKYKPRKPWWSDGINKQKRMVLYKKLTDNPSIIENYFSKQNLDERELFKHTMLTNISFDMNHYLTTGTIIKRPSYLLAFFEPSNNTTPIYSFNETE